MAYSTYIQNFVDTVLGYAQRDATSFVSKTNSVDLVLSAINQMRRQAQQAYDFEQLKTVGAIQINGSSGAPWKTPSGNYGPFTSDAPGSALVLKQIDAVFNYTKDTQGNMQPTNAIPFDNTRWFRRLLPVNMGFPFSQVFPQNPPFYYNTIPTQAMFAYVVGPTFYVNTATAPAWYMIFAQQALADLSGSETSDFFIDNYSQWLLYATIQALNLYLKEDQRVQISMAMVTDAWNKVVFDDAKKGWMGNDWSTLD